LPREVGERLRALARAQRRSVSFIVRDAIEWYCAERPAPPDPIQRMRQRRADRRR